MNHFSANCHYQIFFSGIQGQDCRC